MAILVDEARWEWRGDRWAHLISDTAIDELHRFARELGLRYLSYQGDHYDLPSGRRADAIALGAQAVDSREIVRRLAAAGLRRRGGKRTTTWSRAGGFVAPDVGATALAAVVEPVAGASTATIVDASLAAWAGVDADELAVLHRPGEVVVLMVGGDHVSPVPDVAAGPELHLVNDTAERGRRYLEVVFRLGADRR